jgi:hypothetical protein
MRLVNKQFSGMSLLLTAGLWMSHGAFGQIIEPVNPGHIDMNHLVLAGTGCDGTEEVTLTTRPEGSIISMNFNNFTAVGSDRRACTLRVGVTIPAGYRMIVTEGVPNGSVDVDQDHEAAVASRIHLMGYSTRISEQKFLDEVQTDFGPAAGYQNPSDIFRSRRREVTPCIVTAHRAAEGLMGLNLAASVSPKIQDPDASMGISNSMQSRVTISSAQLGVIFERCP